MKSIKLLLIFILITSAACSQPKNEKNSKITAKEVQEHINYLASDKLEGRLTGTVGARMASDYIRQDFESYGLKPLFDSTYFQYFPFISGVELTGDNSVQLTIKNDVKSLELNKEFTTTPYSGNNKVEGGLVFVGYGISAPDLKYDDYQGIDVHGKIVMLMRYHPEEKNPHSKFMKYSDLRYKAKIAQEKGASGVIFVNGHIPPDPEDKLIKLRYDGARGIDSLCVVQVKRDIADELFKSAGMNFQSVQQEIVDSLKPHSFEFSDVRVKLSTGLNYVEKQGRNVAGYIEGNDPVLKNQYIVIGAHYDHLGYGETGSLYRGKEKLIHNGADDNASGTAGVMELAEKFASEKAKLKRSIIFITFSGEELGTLGSSYFADHSPVPTTDISTMINMDMIGRLNEEKELTVFGAGTSTIWKNLLDTDAKGFNFKLNKQDDGYGPSDHASFYAKKIPVLFFFTGVHADYHRPSDDADKINSKGEETILKYVYRVSSDIDTLSTQPNYVSIPRKSEGGKMSFRVDVGTIPNYADQADGLKINGVREGSPAQKGGLKGGDVIINFGGKKIANIYDYTYALGDFTPGDVVDVIVMRDGKKVTLKVTLGAR